MAVDHRLDLLGVHLLPADVDDPAAASDKMVAAAAQLDDVAGIDKAILVKGRGNAVAEIAERIAPRADAQRAVDDPHFDIVAASEIARRETAQPVADIERHPSLGRGKGVRGVRLRILLAE